MPFIFIITGCISNFHFKHPPFRSARAGTDGGQGAAKIWETS